MIKMEVENVVVHCPGISKFRGNKTWAGEARTVIGLTSTPIPVESDCEAILAS